MALITITINRFPRGARPATDTRRRRRMTVGMGVAAALAVVGMASAATVATSSTTPKIGLDVSQLATKQWWGQSLGSSSYGFNKPDDAVSDGTHLWVTNWGANTVTELNVADGSLAQVISGAGYGFNDPAGIAFDGTHLWVADQGSNALTELNTDGTLVRVVNDPSLQLDKPTGLAFDGSHIWVTDNAVSSGGDDIVALNLDGTLDLAIGDSTSTSAANIGIAWDGTSIWVTDYGLNQLDQVNPATGAVSTISATAGHLSHPWGVTTDAGHIWVVNNGSNTLSEFSSSGRLLRAVGVGASDPHQIAYGNGKLWVTTLNSGTVDELNATDGSLVRQFVGTTYNVAGAYGVYFDGTDIWVTEYGGTQAGTSITEFTSQDSVGTTGNAGGVLAGTYPSPRFATGAVTGPAIAGGAVTSDKISSSGILPGYILTANGATPTWLPPAPTPTLYFHGENSPSDIALPADQSYKEVTSVSVPTGGTYLVQFDVNVSDTLPDTGGDYVCAECVTEHDGVSGPIRPFLQTGGTRMLTSISGVDVYTEPYGGGTFSLWCRSLMGTAYVIGKGDSNGYPGGVLLTALAIGQPNGE